MFASAGLLAQNRKLANAQKLIGNRNRMVQLAELGKKKSTVNCNIGIWRAAKLASQIASGFSVTEYGAPHREIIEADDAINKILQEDVSIEEVETAINAVTKAYNAATDYEDHMKYLYDIAKSEASNNLLELNSFGLHKKVNDARSKQDNATVIYQFVKLIYDIFFLSKTEPTIGGRRTRRNRKNNRKTRRN